MGFWDSLMSGSSSGGGTNWGAIVGGVLAAGSTIYAANQQKKAQDQAYKNQMKQYEQQTAWQNEQIRKAQSSPVAMMAPYLMETLISAYGGKLKKFGVNLPVDQMLAAISGGGGQSAGMQPTTGAGLQASMGGGQRGFNKMQQLDFADKNSEMAREAFGGGGMGRRMKSPYVINDAYLDSIWNQEVGQGARGPGEGPSGTFMDSIRDLSWAYSGLDEGKLGKIGGNLAQFGIGQAAGSLVPGAGLLLGYVDRNPSWMWEYNDINRAPTNVQESMMTLADMASGNYWGQSTEGFPTSWLGY